jgi:hypothetical protein
MRKKKRAAAKLKAAKKQANIMAESSDISERQKLKAISKAMRSNKIDKPEKVYVVTRKTKAGSSGTSGGGKVTTTTNIFECVIIILSLIHALMSLNWFIIG